MRPPTARRERWKSSGGAPSGRVRAAMAFLLLGARHGGSARAALSKGAAKGEIEPPAAGDQARGAGENPIDAVERQARLAGQHADVPGGQAYGRHRVGSLVAADAKDGGIAEGDRKHGMGEIRFIAILVRPHAGAIAV